MRSFRYITAEQARDRVEEHLRKERESPALENLKIEGTKSLIISEIYRIIEKESSLGKTSIDVFHVLGRGDINHVMSYFLTNGYNASEDNQKINISWLKT